MYFISLTRLRVRSVIYLPRFLSTNEASIKAIKKLDGFIAGKELIDKSLTFWTITVWESEKAMKAFRNNEPHKYAMRRLPDWCNEGSYMHWLQEDTTMPAWPQLHHKMITEGKITKVRYPSPQQPGMNYPPIKWTKTERVIKKAEKMITKIEHTELPAFYAVGITVRTINQNGQSKKDMMALWTRFMGDNVLSQIKDRAADDIYCFYTDYESDHNGYYTALLGCKVNSLANISEGFSGLSIPAGKYQVYSLAGDPLHSVLGAWQEIWDSNVARAYTFDFDHYVVNAKNFEESEVKIYLAVK